MRQEVVRNEVSLSPQLAEGAVEIDGVPVYEIAAVIRLRLEARKLWFSKVRSRISPCRWKNTARRKELLASPLFRPAWLRWRKGGSDSHCRVMNSVRSIRPSTREARDRALLGSAAASLRKMTDGSTTPASIETLSRMSSGHWPTTTAVSIASRSAAQAVDTCQASRSCRACGPSGP